MAITVTGAKTPNPTFKVALYYTRKVRYLAANGTITRPFTPTYAQGGSSGFWS